MNNIHKLNGFIYVTSEEKPSIKDWSINLNCKYAHQELCSIDNEIELNSYVNSYENDCRKIILTNDPNLTNVQKLTHEEEAYCKTVDSVEVEKEFQQTADNLRDGFYYQLQLPKQETIEDLVKDYDKEYTHSEIYKEGVIAGYNHAVKTLYTDEEVLAMLLIKHDGLTAEYVLQQFNQNKKK